MAAARAEAAASAGAPLVESRERANGGAEPPEPESDQPSDAMSDEQ
jgi:hypothetical protein